jgi:uncharacterized protein (TIGR03067 family)
MIRQSLLALVLVWTASAGAARPDDDKELLKGTWTVAKSVEDGKPNKETANAKFTFKEDRLLLKLAGEMRAMEATFVLDPSKKPKHIDISTKDGDTTLTAVGIYELDGDKLRLCVAGPDGPGRPTEFKSANRKIIYLELTRDKAK